MSNPVPWAPRSIRSRQPFRSAGIVEVDTSSRRSAEYSSDASNYRDSPTEPSSSSLPTGPVHTSPNSSPSTFAAPNISQDNDRPPRIQRCA
jgi:hypothetical protein